MHTHTDTDTHTQTHTDTHTDTDTDTDTQTQTQTHTRTQTHTQTHRMQGGGEGRFERCRIELAASASTRHFPRLCTKPASSKLTEQLTQKQIQHLARQPLQARECRLNCQERKMHCKPRARTWAKGKHTRDG